RQLHGERRKVGRADSCRRVDFEELVESGVDEDIPKVGAEARQAQLAAAAEQALLRLEEDAEASARNVFEPGAVEGRRSGDAVEEGLRGLRLRGIEPPGDDDDAVGTRFDCQHLFSPSCFPASKTAMRLSRRSGS